MRQQYLALALLAMLAVVSAACSSISGIGQAAPTPIPFTLYTAQDVFNAFARAGLEIQNPEKSTSPIGRDAPIGYRERYLFEVPRIAPAGGQIIIFSTPDQLQAWQAYINRLSSQSETHRDVIYTYFNANVMLQLNASLTNQEAGGFRDVLMGLGK
jgi:hypothetical protein